MDKALRNTLRNVVTQCRKELEKSVAEMLEGQFGIYALGKIDAATAMSHLSAEDQEYRSQLLVHLEHIQAGGFKAKDAAEQLIREMAFTHLNRFCAYKMMEVRKLIRESVSRGYASNNVKFYLAEHPEDERLYNAGQQPTAYRHFLEWLGGTLSEEIGVLFSPHDPANRLLPPQRVLDQVLELLNSEALKDIWAEDETIGWIYQYFTPDEVRRQARKDNPVPQNSYELSFRNQFYTPSYVVQFLTDNTLGRTWYEMRQGETALTEQCQYLVRRQEDPIPHRAKKDPREIRVLDPACGSGHFLLYCFTLLQTIYDEAYDDPALGGALQQDYPDRTQFRQAVPGLILAHNLHGIDIDIRATQIAALALWLRAQRAYQEMGLKKERPKITKSNLVCAEPMPGEAELLEEFIAELPSEELRRLVRNVFDKMTLAGEAGSLLKIEDEIQTFVKEILRPEQLSIFDAAASTDREAWSQLEEKAKHAMRSYAEKAVGTQQLQRQLFSNDAVQGFAFIDVCQKAFDVVLMNPPFGESSIAAKQYIELKYPAAKADIGMAFVDQGLKLCGCTGILGAITSRVLVANDSLETWRDNTFLKDGRLRCFADLGYGVLDEAMVEAAAYIVSVAPSALETFFLRVLDEKDKENAVNQYLINGKISTRTLIFWSFLEIFRNIPGKVLCYWLPESLLISTATAKNLISEGGRARHGLQTTDDFRFLRLAWEVSAKDLGRERHWIYFAKGGEYQPYWDDLHLVINWKNNGEELKNFVSAKAEKTLGSAGWSRWINAWDDYFKSGLTFPERTTSDFSPRVFPANCIFSATGEAIFFEKNDSVLAYLAGAYTRHFKLMMDGFVGSGDSSVPGSAANHYRSGLVNDLPPPCITLEKELLKEVFQGIELARLRFTTDETSRDFVSTAFAKIGGKDLKSLAKEWSFKILNDALNLIELSWKLEPIVESYLMFRDVDIDVIETVVGPHPMSYSSDIQNIDVELLHRLWIDTESNIISYVVQQEGARRQLTKKSYFGNRKLELLAHLFKKAPKIIVNLLEQGNILGSEILQEETQALLSCIVGCVFGRWDLRIIGNSSLSAKLPDPFDPLSICPPGALVSSNGLPATSGNIVSEEWLCARPDVNTLPPESSVQQRTIPDSKYPIQIDWDGILVDDPDHPDDILRRIRDVLEVLWGNRAENIEQEACEILSVKDLRDYFRKPGNGGFWQDHIKRYSKSRRKAPIYWLLQSSKKSYSLWLYYHRLDKDILFKAHTQYVEPKLNLETDKLNQLNNQRATLSGTALKKLERDIEKQESLVSELTDFSDKLQRAAKLDFGRNLIQDVVFDPDLNDGVVLNIAPLWELTPWSEAKKYWQDLIQGKYEWSSIGKQLRAKGIVQC